MRRFLPYIVGLIGWMPGKLAAQHVLYTEPVLERSGTEYHFIGKSDNYYWAEKIQRRKNDTRETDYDATGDQSFLLFDEDLQLLDEIKLREIEGTIRQWLVPGREGLDRITISLVHDKYYIFRSAYSALDKTSDQLQVLDSFSNRVSPSQLIVARSADHSKILILIFEITKTETTGVNALLFDADWNQIYHKAFSEIPFALPYIQDDDFLLSESFDDLPVKVANDGEWIMAFPSRINLNYVLFRVHSNGKDFSLKEFRKFSYYNLEDIAMYLDEENQVAGLGLLSGYSNTSLKNVEVGKYSFKQDKFLFDTSYHFNTQANDFRNKNLSHERFMSFPGYGYLYLKEFGQPFEFQNQDQFFSNNWDAGYLLAGYQNNAAEQNQIKNGYSYNKGLKAIPQILHSGDLNLFYFPSISKDSTWTGIWDAEQHSNTNFPALSYLILPIQNKIYVLYNAIDWRTEPFVSTTMVNLKGQETGAGLVFWKTDRILDFQHYRQITRNEIVTPYHKGRHTGFAIIRFPEN